MPFTALGIKITVALGAVVSENGLRKYLNLLCEILLGVEFIIKDISSLRDILG